MRSRGEMNTTGSYHELGELVYRKVERYKSVHGEDEHANDGGIFEAELVFEYLDFGLVLGLILGGGDESMR